MSLQMQEFIRGGNWENPKWKSRDTLRYSGNHKSVNFNYKFSIK